MHLARFYLLRAWWGGDGFQRDRVLIPETGPPGREWIANVDAAGWLFFAGAWLIILMVTTRVEYHMTGPGATSLLPTGALIVAATTHPHPATRDLSGHQSWALPPKVWALGGVAF